MSIEKIETIYFSPTKTTKKIVDTIAESIINSEVSTIDITGTLIREDKQHTITGDLVIIGAPVYAGKVPNQVKDFLLGCKVEGIPAVLVAVYGNREYDDALLELHDLSSSAGFIPIASGAFIGEHSFSSAKLPMAHGRPDIDDLEKAKEFGFSIKEKFEMLKSENDGSVFVPGSEEYKERTLRNIPIAPKTSKRKCLSCKKCVKLCPVDAISFDKKVKTDKKKCLVCFACIKACPGRARSMRSILFYMIKRKLHKKCLERKEPELFYIGCKVS